MRKFLILIVLLAFTTPADAHKVVASAWTDGADIEGEVGLSNGDVALEGTAVEVFDLDDNLLGETKIGQEGLFRFTPTKAIPHKFRANLGAGHVATLILQVDELPDHLKGGKASIQTQSKNTDQPVDVSSDIQKLVAKAVRKEIQPLRKEIASYKEKNDLQTILGGIGYILGLTGIAFYMAARRKEKKGE
ncbi:MAG: cobalt ABC transporter permease [Terasakiella sp.]|uniref:cobalt ABC transporter permease n=1 Tax=unclassified Terasakiella TaxID=2614952 RepID=UPI003AFF8435